MTSDNPVLLKMKDVCKTFDKNQALNNVNFELNVREIHGLLGGNGAGKTTLMNILYGLYKQDSGEIFLKDHKVEIHSPRDAIRHGVGMVHQHFLQVPSYTVIENIVLGTNVRNSLTMNLEEEEKTIQELCRRFELELDVHARIEDLPMGTRQKVEILKALYRGIKILVLDEPTTNLTPQEVDALFQSLRVMVNEGLSIVFITHKLREVLSVCDRISVLRNGINVITLKRDEGSEDAFVRGMVGDDMDVSQSVIFSKRGRDDESLKIGERVLAEYEHVHLVDEEKIERLHDVSFPLHESEIFGIAGVAGNGQRELAEALIGLQPIRSGRITYENQDCTELDGNILEHGVAYIPEDRLEDGFLPKANVAQNLILGQQRLPPYSRKGFINWGTVFKVASRLISEYNIKTSGPGEVAGNLSGGNIQRVMIARAFAQSCKLMVAHNPTRGLDIASMDFVYKKLLERKREKMATLLLSEDLDELLLICDRIGVLYRGALVGILTRDRFEKYEIGRMMSGVIAGA